MTARAELVDWVYEAVKENGGTATIVQVASHIWKNHESDLKRSGDLFYTWQYDMRWAAQRLRDTGKFKPKNLSNRREWEIL